MKIHDRIKLRKNTGLMQLNLDVMSELIKEKIDFLTITQPPVNKADDKLLTWLRNEIKQGSIINPTAPDCIRVQHNNAILGMFTDVDDDDIALDPEVDGFVVDMENTKPILKAKILENNYLYLLAGVVSSDFTEALEI